MALLTPKSPRLITTGTTGHNKHCHSWFFNLFDYVRYFFY